MRAMSSGFLRNTLFFGPIWHLVLFGSERVPLLTVKNLLIAPGGPDRKFKSPLAPPPAAAAPTSPAGRGGPARAPRSQAARGLDRPRRMG